jgi:hypothetical protein
VGDHKRFCYSVSLWQERPFPSHVASESLDHLDGPSVPIAV